MEPIRVAGPWITQKEIDYVRDAVANAWYANANIYNKRFQEAFAAYLGRRFAIPLPSCTSAIHLSLMALGVGPGDEVIVPELTWIATAAPITYVGAKPVFADVDPKTWCLSAESLERRISSRTKAVIPVDLYGGMPDMEEILRIARKHKIAVIEDAAEAIGSECKGHKAGSFGDTSVFSFHGSKTLTTGEGGMLLTDREDVYDRALFLADHGRSPGPKMFWNSEVAYKYKMSSMQAALGLAQLERVEDLVTQKRKIFGWYEQRLKTNELIVLNCEPAGYKNTYWMVTIVVAKELRLEKERLLSLLSARGINCRPFFYPLSSLPAYDHYEDSKTAASVNINAYRVAPYGVNLPSGFDMTEEKADYICNALASILV